MQRVSKGIGASTPARVAAVRASLRNAGQASDPKLSRPPKPRKATMRESEEDRALKAEKQALAQHTTSLLNGGKPAGKNYKRPGERAERRGTVSGFIFQLVLVLCIAGGVAVALDPTIVPAEWTDQAREFISTHVKI
jgi:hypothetical protein